MSWVCGPWRPFIARRPCPYRGYLRFVCAYAHALSQYFPVPHRPLWLGGLLFFMSVRSPNPNIRFIGQE
ncbi:hypothetical protein K435DRAFT_926971 [Dendrothele bispora CBS 962.96]|uniref:Uncharacterized protein n=1 Tax=Dendrothele bispora (strain CBS 962.96) TaxID=1314807 RepID=A0A4S8L8P1_DENBC|nr:hypothetical protein K435DRAFT_926971 [Dendrothele bispora CBS 962.96]